MSERYRPNTNLHKERTSLKEKALTVSKRVDEVQIGVGVLLIPVFPIVAAGLIGPSFVTRVLAGKEHTKVRDERIAKELPKAA